MRSVWKVQYSSRAGRPGGSSAIAAKLLCCLRFSPTVHMHDSVKDTGQTRPVGPKLSSIIISFMHNLPLESTTPVCAPIRSSLFQLSCQQPATLLFEVRSPIAALLERSRRIPGQSDRAVCSPRPINPLPRLVSPSSPSSFPLHRENYHG